jgi:hypothetical protein
MEKVTFQSLGREIKISPKSLLVIEKRPSGDLEGTVEITIGSGRAKLILDGKAIALLNVGTSIKITTAKEFKQKIK